VSDGALRRCPKDGRKLWPTPQPRQLRFHDLRHTPASLLLESGASLAAVSCILRREDPKLTMRVYGHLADDFLRDEMDRMKLGVEAPRAVDHEAVRLSKAANAGSFAAPVLHGQAEHDDRPQGTKGKGSLALGKIWSGRQDSNLRPPGPKPGALPG